MSFNDAKSNAAWDSLYQDCKAYAKKHGYSLSGLKTFTGMDGQGFNATLLKDGKRVVFAVNEGSGGMTLAEDLPNVPRFQRIAFETALKAEVNQRSTSYGDVTPDFDIFMDALIEEEQERKSWKRKCTSSVCFTLKSGKPNDYLQIKGGQYTKELVAKLEQKYGNDLNEIINARFGEPADTGAAGNPVSSQDAIHYGVSCPRCGMSTGLPKLGKWYCDQCGKADGVKRVGSKP